MLSWALTASAMYHTCITDEPLFPWDLNKGSHYIVLLYVTTKEDLLLFRGRPHLLLRYVHLLLNRFGELCLCPTTRQLPSMLTSCRLCVREAAQSEGRYFWFSFFPNFSSFSLWILMEIFRMETVPCSWEWFHGRRSAVLEKPGHRLRCLCLCV